MRNRRSRLYALLCVACVVATARTASAQPVDAPGGAKDPSAPRFTVGGAIGTPWDTDDPLALLSVQAPLARDVVAEFEATRRVYDESSAGHYSYNGYLTDFSWHDQGRTLTFGGNVMFRAGARHFVGSFIFPPIGAAAGAGIGAMIGASRRHQRTLYP